MAIADTASLAPPSQTLIIRGCELRFALNTETTIYAVSDREAILVRIRFTVAAMHASDGLRQTLNELTRFEFEDLRIVKFNACIAGAGDDSVAAHETAVFTAGPDPNDVFAFIKRHAKHCRSSG